MKGKIDPNLNSYARQNAAKNQGQQEQLATMTVHELINYKQDVSLSQLKKLSFSNVPVYPLVGE